jgi:FAD dependent oxidoreductase TIGR03364
MMPERFDDAVVGAGIVGLAHAYTLAKRGRRVIVFERNARAMGASVRNFGMIWPIGQPAGEWYNRARRSRDIWLEVLPAAGLWHRRSGSLHLAYREDEAAVLQEFIAAASSNGFDCEWHDAAQITSMSAGVNPEGLLGGMWSVAEVCVDPREVIAGLPGWLQQTYGVQFEFNCAVTGFDHPKVLAGGREWEADNLFVCSGEDFQTLYPEVFAASGLYRCKLQMMRSQGYGNDFKLGPMLAAGLTLGHYQSFKDCPSLPALKKRFEEEQADYLRYGIHVMASQNGQGEITIGDSHEYGDDITPFDKDRIDRLILDYLQTFLRAPQLKIASRWNGVYAKHPTENCFTARPAKGVTIIASPGGAGMTLSFGVAEKVVQEIFGES